MSIPAASMPPSSRPSRRLSILSARRKGDELIADLFDALHELHFARGALEGANFALSLAADKLGARIALCHVYDINHREFVVARARPAGALLARTPERERHVAQAMRKRRAVVVPDAAGDSRFSEGRWALVGEPVRSLLVAPVALGGRFLGLLELANPSDGGEFDEGDGHALVYIADQLAEFIGRVGLVIDEDAIRAYDAAIRR
jgi:GAF domain-containing protein